MDIKLVCHNKKCAKEQSIEVDHLPQFGFELADMAKKAGWVGVVDTGQSMTFIFCSDKCADSQKYTKRAFVW